MPDSPTRISTTTRPSARAAKADRDLRDRLGVSRTAPAPARLTLASRAIEALKTALWVVPLTILLWAYAEREQLDQFDEVPAQIELRGGATDRLAILVSPEDRRLFLDLEGPRQGLNAVRDALRDRLARPLELGISDDLEPGEYDIAAAERLNNDPLFARNAVTVTRARPSVRVRIEPKLSRTVPVRMRPEDKIVGTVVFQPAEVAAEGPAPLLSAVAQDRLTVVADLSRFAGKPPGEYEGDVPISLAPKLDNVTIPQAVHAKVTIRKSEEEKLESIPVRVDMPASVLRSDKYLVEAPVTLPNVTVTGPPEAIQALREGRFVPAAVIELRTEEFSTPGEKVKHLRPEDYVMPEGVKVTQADREVTVNIVNRGG